MLIGVLSLVKPHAFSLILGVGTFFVLRDRLRARGIVATAVLFLAFYTVRVVLGHLLTGGEWIWSLTGTSYAGMLSAYHIDFFAVALKLTGHISAIIALIGIPLAATFVFVIRGFGSRAGSPMESRLSDLGLLACCVLIAMLAMTVYFSQSVYQISPDTERITRLHGRYYVYALPLIVLVQIGVWKNKLHLLLSSWVVAGLCVAMQAAAAIILLKFEVGPVDFPDLVLLRYGFLSAIMALTSVLVLFCLRRVVIQINELVIGSIIWWAAVVLLTSARLLNPFGNAFAKGPVDAAFFDPMDRSGLRQLVGRGDGSVIGTPTSAVDTFRVMFYLRSRSAGRIVPVDTTISDDDFRQNAVSWVVLSPGTHYTGSFKVTQTGPLSVIWKP